MNARKGIVGDNAPVDGDDGFTQRVIMSLVFDITTLAEGVERIKVQVFAMAKERGISTDV
jgi:hypothetical protein